MTQEKIDKIQKYSAEKALSLPKGDILRLLDDDQLYYGSFGDNWYSRGFLVKLLDDPFLLKADEVWGNGSALVIGNFVHKCILEPHKVKDFEYSLATHRAQNQYKEDLANSSYDRWMFLEKDFIKWKEFSDNILLNDEVKRILRDPDNEYEVPLVSEFNGLPIKGKCDIINHKKKLIIDLKTTSDLTTFADKVDEWHYNVQAAMYAKALLDGEEYTFRFVAVDKKTGKTGVFDISKGEMERGVRKLYKCTNLFKHYHINDKENIYYHYL